VEGAGETCLIEEVERLRRSGLPAEEISRRLGLDLSWVESVMLEDDAEPEQR
jgi:hypothetical protein